jgi:hypothetical protein
VLDFVNPHHAMGTRLADLQYVDHARVREQINHLELDGLKWS